MSSSDSHNLLACLTSLSNWFKWSGFTFSQKNILLAGGGRQGFAGLQQAKGKQNGSATYKQIVSSKSKVK